jgi:hypothetical protein
VEEKDGDSMNYRDRMIYRLKAIELAPKVFSDEAIIQRLQDKLFVSVNYSFRNLAVDRWYLSSRVQRLGYDIAECHDCNNPIKSVWFRVIVMALADVRSERPCDLNAWDKDLPPMGIEKCTEDCHICSPAARGWLLNLDDVAEEFAGLSHGTIISILKSKRKNRIQNLCP